MKILPAIVIPARPGDDQSRRLGRGAPTDYWTGCAWSFGQPATSVSRGPAVVEIGERMNRTQDVDDEKFGDGPLGLGAALAEFPELRRLVDLLRAGWQFLPVSSGEEFVEVRGVRVWPDEGVDAITMRFTTDAAGLRRDRYGDVVWERAGDLADVIDGLLALPAPSDPAAPRLVLRTSTRLWTPTP